MQLCTLRLYEPFQSEVHYPEFKGIHRLALSDLLGYGQSHVMTHQPEITNLIIFIEVPRYFTSLLQKLTLKVILNLVVNETNQCLHLCTLLHYVTATMQLK